MHNASWSGISASFKAVYGLLNVLLAIRLLGAEAYGSLATLLAWFVLYLSLNSSIFTMLVVKLMALRQDERERSDVLLASVLLTSLSVVFILASAALVGMRASGTSGLGAGFGASAPDIPMLMAILVSTQIVTAYQSALLESSGRLDLAMKRQMVGPVVVLAALLFSFLSGESLTPAGYVGVLCLGAMTDLSLVWLVRRAVMPWTAAMMVTRGTFISLKAILRSGGQLQATSLMNMFIEPLNKLLLNHFLGGAAVSVYDLAMKVVWGIQNLFAAGMRIFLHMGSQEHEAVGSRFSFVIRIIGVPAILLHVIGALFLSVVAHHWLQLDAVVLLVFYAVATLSNLGMIFVTPLYVGLIGRGDLGFVFRTQAILAVTNILASFVFIPLLGVAGAAVGLFVATAYNATAILLRARHVLSRLVGLRAALWHSRFRYFAAAVLFAASISWGVSDAASWIILGVILVGSVAISVSDPALIDLIKRFTAGAGAERRHD
ncbi:oligosaccharide flippase family protein [Thiobacillus sp.]|uniref:lipopolysaccharide biosynthesis protein n=1 Tax=Thiobacillus sp. TaxID=924 RepID=UPI00286E8727|nr:oligosaccharide flippase family protein [Thiobacillus sp.]